VDNSDNEHRAANHPIEYEVLLDRDNPHSGGKFGSHSMPHGHGVQYLHSRYHMAEKLAGGGFPNGLGNVPGNRAQIGDRRIGICNPVRQDRREGVKDCRISARTRSAGMVRLSSMSERPCST
jgi:hypothetical protein